LIATLTCWKIDHLLELQSLGYEPYDARLRCLNLSLVTALTSVDLRREVFPDILRLPRLSLSRRVRFTNPFTCGARRLRRHLWW
jgi:hypothetical protein